MPRRFAVRLLVTSASDRFFDRFIVQSSSFVLHVGVLAFLLSVEVELLHLGSYENFGDDSTS